jgi:glycosyltransferase involved in cell wall biosynthesis
MPFCVSVIMPVRDGGRWIGEAIASLAAQSLADFELLVIDDGSKDDTGRIVAAAAQGDTRIRLITQAPSGMVAALNRGLDAARAELIARLDADDRAYPVRLERQVAFLKAHPAIGLVGSWADVIDANGTIIGRRQPETQPAALARILERHNPLLHSSMMWRTGLIAAVGHYRAAIAAAEDYDLWLRMAEHTQVANIPETLVQYRTHSGAVTRRDNLRQLFSTRLARRAAHARRTTGADPADALAAPPNWNAADAERGFFSDDAMLYRFLELATNAEAPIAAGAALPREPSGEFGLTHDERRLAQLALLNVMTPGHTPSPRRRVRLLYDFVRLHPARAIRLIATPRDRGGA